MSEITIELFVVGAAAALLALVLICAGPRIVSLLIGKYLRRRWIAWVPLLGMAMCIVMVVVVISVMGGWLRMFRQSFHGLDGDIIVRGDSLTGFPYYQQMIDGIDKLPEVGPGHAVPVLRSIGLLNIANQQTSPVQVIGYPIAQIGKVNQFPQSLHRQYAAREDARAELKHPQKLSPEQRELDQEIVDEPVKPLSFDLLPNQATVPLVVLPPGVNFDAVVGDRLRYDAQQHLLIWDAGAWISDGRQDALLKLSNDPIYQKAIRFLTYKSRWEAADYDKALPRLNGRARLLTGMIPSAGVLGIEKDEKGNIVGRSPELYRLPVALTVLEVNPGSSNISKGDKSESHYWIVDDSRTKVWATDSNTVYVPFEKLQGDLGMDQRVDDSGNVTEPARTSEICIKVQSGVDLVKAKAAIAAVVLKVQQEHPSFVYPAQVKTWEETQALFLGAVENEASLMTFLFGLMSLVAILCIFCIFYMIVIDKTRDIGIIKSVGATNTGVAGIFLGYGLAIGLAASMLGLLISYFLVTYINEIHSWMGQHLGVRIWNPKVYQFDSIPNQLNPKQVAWILVVAVISAVLGALVPAVRAAWLHPIDALRWE